MTDQIELLVYSRSYGCPYITIAKRVLSEHALAYREIYIDKDADAKARVIEWTGFQSVPTIVVTESGGLLPIAPPSPLAKGASPRGIDRGAMITEASFDELERWLRKHGFIPAEAGT
jgi:glutaredoxin